MNFLKRHWIVTPVLAIVLICLLVLVMRETRDRLRIAAFRAHLGAAGLPNKFSELQSAEVLPEEDAETYLKRAQSATTEIEDQVTQFIKTLPDEQRGSGCSETIPPAAIEMVREALAKHPEAIAQIITASNCSVLHVRPEGQWGSPGVPAYFERLRSATRTLNYRVAVQLAGGDHGGVLESALAIFRLGRLAEQSPSLLGHLVNNAIKGVGVLAANRVLRSGTLPNADHERLEMEVALGDPLESFRQAMRTEQLRMLDRFAESLDVSPVTAWVFSLFVNESEYLDYINLAIDRGDEPLSTIKNEVEAARDSLQRPLNMLAPGVAESLGSLAKTRAGLRCLRVFNRLLVQDPDGIKGLSIDQLGLPAEAITDPYDGMPLRMMHGANGWKVYSVGQNLQDDGGRLDDQSDVGVGPTEALPEC